MISVTLTAGEWGMAAAAGFERHLLSVIKGSMPDWQDGTELEHHILGALGEAAWHKWRGIWWPAPINVFNEADAEGFIQIRTTPRRHPFFKVKPKDNPAFMAVFIIGGERTFEIVGCINVGVAQRRYGLSDPGGRNRPCYEIPRADLIPVAEFLQTLKQKVNGNLVSRCYAHGEYCGDGNCPTCELERMGIT